MIGRYKSLLEVGFIGLCKVKGERRSWRVAADCKSVILGLVGSNPSSPTKAPLVQLVEASALEAEGSRFESVAGHHSCGARV